MSLHGAATALGIESQRGCIEPGKLADLVILTRDPLADIRNARAIAAVIKGRRLAWRSDDHGVEPFRAR
jgi:imidazolonepropionase-like amidohydrolase